MLNFVNTIPEAFGWALVGFVACLCFVMACKLGKLFAQMWKEYHEEEN